MSLIVFSEEHADEINKRVEEGDLPINVQLTKESYQELVDRVCGRKVDLSKYQTSFLMPYNLVEIAMRETSNDKK